MNVSDNIEACCKEICDFYKLIYDYQHSRENNLKISNKTHHSIIKKIEITSGKYNLNPTFITKILGFYIK